MAVAGLLNVEHYSIHYIVDGIDYRRSKRNIWLPLI